MTHRERTEEIAREAAQAARMAADETETPEARSFLRRHAPMQSGERTNRRPAPKTRP